jgi:DNA topoisomerase-3
VTAQLECLLDDVVVGKQEMIGAIDAVCDVAQRIIGKLKESAAEGPPLLGASVVNGASAYPPTLAMKRFADSLSRKKGIKPPPGYKTSISICRKFLSEHAPKKADGKTVGKLDPKPSPAQLLYAKKIAQRKGLIILDDAKTSSATMSAWIDSNRDKTRYKRKAAYKSAGSIAPQSTAPSKRDQRRKANTNTKVASPTPASVAGTRSQDNVVGGEPQRRD